MRLSGQVRQIELGSGDFLDDRKEPTHALVQVFFGETELAYLRFGVPLAQASEYHVGQAMTVTVEKA